MTDLLLVQQGQVAISGYGQEWDHLGWTRSEKESRFVFNGETSISESRVEVLWMNYDINDEKSIGGLFGS